MRRRDFLKAVAGGAAVAASAHRGRAPVLERVMAPAWAQDAGPWVTIERRQASGSRLVRGWHGGLEREGTGRLVADA